MKYSELPDNLKVSIHGKVIEHEDGSISVDGHVRWGWERLAVIPIKFRRVTGTFDCTKNRLTSLENAPDWVGGNFNCGCNKLTSVEHVPKYIGGSFWCDFNELTSLDGLGEVKGEIACNDNLVSEEELIADYRQKRAKKDLALESLAVERILT